MPKQKLTEKQQELLKEYKVVSGRVNKRLERLEKLAQNPDYENVLKYAYRLAERDVKELGLINKSDKIRYRIPKDSKGNINTNKLESALRRVKAFETSYKTTTKSDIDVTYKKDAAAFNRAFGTNFTWQELKTFMDASDWNKIKKERGSANIQQVIKSMTANNLTAEEINKYLSSEDKSKIIQDVNEANELHKKIQGMDAVTLDWYKRLQSEGVRFDMLKMGASDDFVEAEDSPFID